MSDRWRHAGSAALDCEHGVLARDCDKCPPPFQTGHEPIRLKCAHGVSVRRSCPECWPTNTGVELAEPTCYECERQFPASYMIAQPVLPDGEVPTCPWCWIDYLEAVGRDDAARIAVLEAENKRLRERVMRDNCECFSNGWVTDRDEHAKRCAGVMAMEEVSDDQ